MTQPHEKQLLADGHHLMVYDWAATMPNATPIFFLHATGFHGRCWDEIIRQLPQYQRYAVDLTGHGRSYKPEPSGNLWHETAADVVAVAQALGLQGAIGVGHSLGGNMLVRAAAALPEAFAALMLIDPVIMPRDYYALDDYEIEGHFVLQRKRRWNSFEEMIERFRGRGPFANWEEAVLRDYCQYGLLPDGDDFVLACSPEHEVHTYMSSRLRSTADIYDAIAEIKVPVRVLRCTKGLVQSNFDLAASPTDPDLASYFADGLDVPLADNTHFIPMESPALVARHIKIMAQQV